MKIKLSVKSVSTRLMRALFVTSSTFCIVFTASGSSQNADVTQMSDRELPQLLRKLRSMKGHFNGGAWNNATDKWQGTKHVVMQRLGEKIWQEKASAAQIKHALGEPDAQFNISDAKAKLIVEQSQWKGIPEGTLWLYHWRGTHDQLAITVANKKISALAWFYQGE
jgi:membrane-associated HD superfamily phosphohydrolase